MLRVILSFIGLVSAVHAKLEIHHMSAATWCSGLQVRGGNVSPTSSTNVLKKKKKRKIPHIDQPTLSSPVSDATIFSDVSMGTAVPPINDTMSVSTQPTNKEKSSEHMPSLFTSPNESIYDKYAACVAATEGLRRSQEEMHRAKEDQTSLSKRRFPWNPLRSQQKKSSSKYDSEQEKRKHAQYILQSGKIIRSLGLTVSQFNQISREVAKDIPLKDRVMEQAYLYRLTAAVNMDKVPIIEDPESEKLLKSHRRRRVQMFARSMTEIEELRTEQIERLRKSLNIEHLPAGFNICDPNILPLLNRRVRAVCEAFPLQAEEIVNKYGLNSNEFNQMLEETRGNPVFRWRVKKYIGKTTDTDKLPIPLEEDSEE